MTRSGKLNQFLSRTRASVFSVLSTACMATMGVSACAPNDEASFVNACAPLVQAACDPESGRSGCVLVACFGGPHGEAGSLCDGMRVAHVSLPQVDRRCRDEWMQMTSDSNCYPGWRRASFEPERAQCLTEEQREKVYFMTWHQPNDESTP